MRLYALQFGLNLDIFFRLPGPLCLNLFPLLGFVGIQGILTRFGALQHFVDRSAGRIESHQHRRPPHLLR